MEYIIISLLIIVIVLLIILLNKKKDNEDIIVQLGKNETDLTKALGDLNMILVKL
jgi:regulatory protein YycI of two-component signal transduction system YycFG